MDISSLDSRIHISSLMVDSVSSCSAVVEHDFNPSIWVCDILCLIGAEYFFGNMFSFGAI